MLSQHSQQWLTIIYFPTSKQKKNSLALKKEKILLTIRQHFYF